MADGAVRVRKAAAADAAVEHAIFCASVGQLHRGRNFEWSDPPFETFERNRSHVLATDPERCWVAELDGVVVGYSRAFVRDGTWFFASLFVDPAVQGRGIGARLFDLAVEGAPSRRLTITDSIQPISNALYGLKGLLPVAPLIRLDGTAARPGSSGLKAVESSMEELGTVDRAAYGFDRSIDHPHWSSLGTRHAWARDGEVVAWSYRWPDGNIGPLAATDDETAGDALRAELALDPTASIELPSTARALLSTALAAGLRIKPPMGLLLASDGVPAPTALAISTYGLY